MKLIIAGGRDFDDHELMDAEIYKIADQNNMDVTELIIVSGLARGADEMGMIWADDNCVPVKEFPAQWDKYGKSAGYKRNMQMAEYADALLAFWDGKSKGTQHMINIAQEQGLSPIRIVNYINN